MNQSQFQQAAGFSAGLAARWYPHITAAMKEFGITAPVDQAMFIAQCGHESTGFTQLVESFNYSVGGLAYFVKVKRLTQDQANMLGRKSYEKSLPIEPLSQISCTASGSAIRQLAMDGSTGGAELSGSPSWITT